MRAVAHPLRLQLLSTLTGESLSASELGRRLGQSAANVSFHLRKLREAGLVEVVGEERVRGGVAKLYRHDPASGERLQSDVGFPVLASHLGRELSRRAALVAEGSTPRFTDFEGWVDRGTADRVSAMVRQIGEILHEAGADRTRLAVTLAAFEMEGTAE